MFEKVTGCQEDGFVGVLKKYVPGRLALMGLIPFRWDAVPYPVHYPRETRGPRLSERIEHDEERHAYLLEEVSRRQRNTLWPDAMVSSGRGQTKRTRREDDGSYRGCRTIAVPFVCLLRAPNGLRSQRNLPTIYSST